MKQDLLCHCSRIRIFLDLCDDAFQEVSVPIKSVFYHCNAIVFFLCDKFLYSFTEFHIIPLLHLTSTSLNSNLTPYTSHLSRYLLLIPCIINLLHHYLVHSSLSHTTSPTLHPRHLSSTSLTSLALLVPTATSHALLLSCFSPRYHYASFSCVTSRWILTIFLTRTKNYLLCDRLMRFFPAAPSHVSVWDRLKALRSHSHSEV